MASDSQRRRGAPSRATLDVRPTDENTSVQRAAVRVDDPPRSDARHLVFSVMKVREGSALAVGAVFETYQRRALIGRGADADVRLNDRTVSRAHAEVVDTGDALVLRNLTRRGATFVERRPLEADEETTLAAEEAHVQIGGVLLRVRSTARTTAFQQALSIDGDTPWDDESGSEPLLRLTWDAGRCHVRLNGRILSLYPAAASVLAALAATPGEPVHRFDLEDALAESGSVEQQISMLRRALADEVTAGHLSLDALRGFVRTHSSGAHIATLDTMDARAVLRHFIAAKRGYGYVLCLGDDDVVVDEGTT